MFNVWDQQPDEPQLWYNRFRRWLENDPITPRSILSVYNAERWQKHQESVAAGHEKAGKGGKRSGEQDDFAPNEGMIDTYTPARCLPTAWHRAKKRYQWKERAQAYDEERLQRDLEEWENRQAEERKRHIDELLRPKREAREKRLLHSLAALARADAMLARARAQQSGTKLRKSQVLKRATKPVEATPLWNQWSSEPDVWFRRFARWLAGDHYSRSILAMYKSEGNNPRARCLSGNWTRAITKWQWRRRAGAYDLDRWRKEIARNGAEISFLTPAEQEWKHAVEQTGQKRESLLRTVAPILATGGGRNALPLEEAETWSCGHNLLYKNQNPQ